MEQRVKYRSFFEPETVCTGDILQSKENRNLLYVVMWINVEGEEWYCMEAGRSSVSHGCLTDVMKWIGFEHVEEYNKGIFEN
jgi:hypothetical protein